VRSADVPAKHVLEVVRASVPRQRDSAGVVHVVADLDGARSAVLDAARGLTVVAYVPDASPALVDLLRLDLGRLGGVTVIDNADGPATAVPLDPQIRELLELLISGSSLGDAAKQLHLSRRTADRRLAEARRLLGARSTAALLVAYGVDTAAVDVGAPEPVPGRPDSTVSRIRP
jgi:DNA-binding CsgD family transcriptional regulator